MAENNQAGTFDMDPAANAPDAAAIVKGKGKGKAVDYRSEAEDVEMREESSSDESVVGDLVRTR
jgi:hypothetical protein